MNTPQQGGASVNARQHSPSTDLTQLIRFLIKAFPADTSQPDTALAWQVLSVDKDKKRLNINTYGVLRRFLKQSEMLKAFAQSDSSGFLRDFASPPQGVNAKMGGRLFNEKGLSETVMTLKKLVTAELEQYSVTELLVDNPKSALQALAKKTGIKDCFQKQDIKMMAIEFSDAEHAIARVFSATEEIQAEDWLNRLSSNLVEIQSRKDNDFGEIERDKLVATLKQDFEKSDSQVTRFLNFLEDEALARVRLQVSFAMMDSLAAQSSKPEHAYFVQYVKKVLKLFELFAVPESPHPLHLNLAGDYGFKADFSMTEQLVKALFYQCLPVWAEWNVQLFESHKTDDTSKGVFVIRDVSYRFRVNGKNPNSEHLSTFEARIERWRKVLNEELDEKKNVCRPLSEVFFLYLVLNPDVYAEDLLDKANKLATWLNSKKRLNDLLDKLSSWHLDVQGLSKTLVRLLKDNSKPAIERTQSKVADLFLVVEQSVVNWDALDRGGSGLNKPFKTGQDNDRVEWFKHIKITQQPNEVSNSLFSIQVRTQLHDRTLSLCESDNVALTVQRELPKQLLNITWRSMRVDDRQTPIKKELGTDIDAVWRMNAGVDIWFDPELLTYRKPRPNKEHKPKYTDEDKRQYRAAAATALAVLVYVILQVLSKKLNKPLNTPLTALMLRFQTQGKQDNTDNGNSLIYAVSHAIESALMRDVSVRMQGLVTEGERFYKDKGAAYALSAAFPLRISSAHQPMLDKVAVIVYSTRPCDDHPNLEKGFVFQAKTYLADSVAASAYRFSLYRMQTYVVENDDAFKNPQLIMEEIKQLQTLGYAHIILMANHLGDKRINRIAQRHSPHAQKEFLNHVATKFANVHLYLLRSAVFPATRLQKRNKGESAFEATKLAIHNGFKFPNKELKPIYAFATLCIVGNDEAARPQSGFCTYFLDVDYQAGQWGERMRSEVLVNNSIRNCLLQVLRGLHFLEAEKQPDTVFKPVLEPFSWISPNTIEKIGEIVAIPSRRKGNVILSLPALLSHVTGVLHKEQD